jgi:hypothetical protein
MRPTPRARAAALLAALLLLAATARAQPALDADAQRDLARLRALGGTVPGPAELELAERLLGRHGPDLPGLPEFVSGLYLRGAHADHAGGRAERARERARRAADLAPEQPGPWRALAALDLEAGRWIEAEASARRALERGDGGARLPLGWALYRQHRDAEAVVVLEEHLATADDADARALLDRLRRQQREEAGMAERRGGRFHLRFEGEPVAGVGEAILATLERHRATLAATFFHEPEAPIPVILYSREAYHDATGAPRWSGGAFDVIDGRVKVPVAGLGPELPAELDAVLMHELTHAFVADLSKGVCPRDLHEGLAQYMAGERSDERTAAVVERGGVVGFYAGALSFVEHLVARRGIGGLRALLEAMAETRSEAAAFERVYDRGPDEERAAWREALLAR